jgi:hypothetical protein
MNYFNKTVSALVHTIAAEHDRSPAVRHPGPYLGVTEFVTAQVAGMSAPLRLPMRLATCGLSVLALVTTGKPFHGLPEPRRRRLVNRWRTSRIGPVRDVVRFYDSLTAIALYGLDGT